MRVLEVESSRFQTGKGGLNRPALAIAGLHLFEVGSIGDQQDGLAVGGSVQTKFTVTPS